jgi:hypothetical protein
LGRVGDPSEFWLVQSVGFTGRGARLKCLVVFASILHSFVIIMFHVDPNGATTSSRGHG